MFGSFINRMRSALAAHRCAGQDANRAVIELRSNTGKHLLPPNLNRPLSVPEWVELTIDTDCPNLLKSAWAHAANAITRRPPCCPISELEGGLWTDWISIAINLAIRQPMEMENWASGFIRGGSELEDAADQMVEAWRQQYPKVKKLIQLPKGNAQAMAALARVFVWGPYPTGDARPGLLESRWFRLPEIGKPLLWMHLSHPATPLPQNADGEMDAHSLATELGA